VGSSRHTNIAHGCHLVVMSCGSGSRQRVLFAASCRSGSRQSLLFAVSPRSSSWQSFYGTTRQPRTLDTQTTYYTHTRTHHTLRHTHTHAHTQPPPPTLRCRPLRLASSSCAPPTPQPPPTPLLEEEVVPCLPTTIWGEVGPERFPLPPGPLSARRCSTSSPPACTIRPRLPPLPARASPPPPQPGGEAGPTQRPWLLLLTVGAPHREPRRP
jgi:hypothetical protein